MQQFTCHHLVDKPELLDKVAEAAQEEWGHINPDVGLAERKEYIQRHMQYSGVEQMLVAVDDNNDFAGMAGLTSHDMRNRKDLFGWLTILYVLPKYRGLGLGTWLTMQVEAQAIGEGLETIYLYTHDAQDFYSSIGWEKQEDSSYFGYPVTIMCKRLVAVLEQTPNNIYPFNTGN